MLHINNGRVHKALSIRQFLFHRNIALLDLQLYFPDLASWDYFFPSISSMWPIMIPSRWMWFRASYSHMLSNGTIRSKRRRLMPGGGSLQQIGLIELMGIPEEYFLQCREIWEYELDFIVDSLKKKSWILLLWIEIHCL